MPHAVAVGVSVTIGDTPVGEPVMRMPAQPDRAAVAPQRFGLPGWRQQHRTSCTVAGSVLVLHIPAGSYSPDDGRPQAPLRGFDDAAGCLGVDRSLSCGGSPAVAATDRRGHR